VLFLVGVIVGLLVLLALLWGLISAILEFVFVESLRSDTVAIRTYWSDRWRQGVRLFVFRIVLALPLLALVVGWLVVVFGPLLTGVGSPALFLGALLVGIPLFFLLAVLYGLVNGFTTVFVVPIMILDDCGVIAAWRRLWSSITAAWKQYLAYAVVGVVLSFAAGILASIVLGLVAVIVSIPLAVVGFLLQVAIGLTSTVGIALLGLLVLVFVAVMVPAWALVQVPILVYLRYYALLVLGDIDESLDLIPDRRQEIRSEA
jgi:hypothetical protein